MNLHAFCMHTRRTHTCRPRVVAPGPGERGFHIFYQLLAMAGGNRDLQSQLGLATAESYQLLSGNNRVLKNGSMDDAREFAELRCAVSTMGDTHHMAMLTMAMLTMAMLTMATLTMATLTVGVRWARWASPRSCSCRCSA